MAGAALQAVAEGNVDDLLWRAMQGMCMRMSGCGQSSTISWTPAHL